MLYISLGIHGLLDQHIALRTGGLYWVTVDQPTDAKRLVRQFLECIPPAVPASLIVCADSVQHVISDLAPDRGPDKLKLFELAPNVVERGLNTLTRDLSRSGIPPNSQILLVAPASSWADTTTAKHLQRWCENLRSWLRDRQVTLLVITQGEATRLHAQLLQLNEHLSGLSQLYRHSGEIRYHVHFWYNDMGVSAGQEFKLQIADNALALIPEPVALTPPRVADDQHVYLAEREVLEGTPPLSKHWYLFNDRQALLEHAASASAATVIVGIDSSHQLLDLAQQLHDLREHCGPALKIVVRELEPAVRYRDERLLLACGVNLIVPDGTLLSRFLSMIESVQGQHWQYAQGTDFATLLERQRPPGIRGLVSPNEFFTEIKRIYQDSSGEVTHQLVKFQPVPGLKPALFLNQMCLRRYGDFACLFNDDVYLFLFACRADGLDPALGNICRLPWRDLFLQRQVLSSPADLDEAAFMQEVSVPEHLSIPVETLVMAQPAAGSHAPLKPQRITLSVSEPQP
ncbi:cellulose biosynthesis protein BcsE [Pseudomonas sp. CCC3.1]|uniref:cellulose biosynthesis protein BcsE n=1 Tax=Pseudomonas sp. CCC3.1 TaxID=3048607 RepID=UPI002AC8B38D|nr:cellulose biosynthesis protein BcsE [Pseudomonas sp. CCC3.1]MEB0204756.1 cellulose biosynthesis protein BcsE [Pseudomonas sp. CCC3.1]WPX38903.1 cellulose biosynthesis protein BcsE [Pseudomonas sp. CCC3.1]